MFKYCEYIIKILERINHNKTIFINDYLIQEAIIYNLIKISEIDDKNEHLKRITSNEIDLEDKKILNEIWDFVIIDIQELYISLIGQ